MSQPTTRFESADVSPAPLGEPLHFEFSGLTAQNRLMKAAMSEQLASWDPKNFEARGIPGQELVNVYQKWGEGQYGVILSGNVMIGTVSNLHLSQNVQRTSLLTASPQHTTN